MDVEFLGSFTSESLPDETHPEVAVAGRSNVGKSSFINTVLARRNIARTSSTPGKTRTVNLYLCERAYILADLPGYGYSKASRPEKARWARDVELYLTRRTSLRGIVIVADIRHFPMAIDREAIEWFSSLGRPLLVVLTKTDKLGRRELKKRESDISGVLSKKSIEYVLFSAKTSLGKKEVSGWIRKTARS
jgi:GTP-binding protein